MNPDNHARRRIGVILHRWHRRLGVAAGLFVLWLAGSGIALNHSADLGLDRSAVSAPWIIRLYGLHAAIPDRGYLTARHWLVGNEVQTVLDGRLLAVALPGTLGLIASGDLLFAANASTLALFDAQGRLVESLHDADLPITSIHRIGQGCGAVVIADEQGHRFFSRDGLTWSPCAGAIVWSTSVALPAVIQARAANLLRPQLPTERVLLDAHSGHIFGRYGSFVMDTVGVLFILIALSGLWMFLRHHLRRGHP